jgi:hypothetical protein
MFGLSVGKGLVSHERYPQGEVDANGYLHGSSVQPIFLGR